VECIDGVTSRKQMALCSIRNSASSGRHTLLDCSARAEHAT